MNQRASTLLLIRPSHFGFNPETAASNSFQQRNDDGAIHINATDEFNAFADVLESEHIQTIIKNDLPERVTPDAVFPNNWVSFHHDGKVILYPMESPLRRNERRHDLIEQLQHESEFEIASVVDLTTFEKEGKFLEGTGSIVFDHGNKKAYMAESSRSHPQVLEKVCEILGYTPLTFATSDFTGKPVYHTNVLLTIGTHFVVLCRESIASVTDQNKVQESFEANAKIIVEISNRQMAAFAGNMLEVQNNKGDPYLILSAKALESLHRNQIRKLEQFATLLPVKIPTIEKIGGGSVRCMMAEVFLPLKNSDNRIDIRSPKGKNEYDEYFLLRWKLLRKPWNQPQDDKSEASEIHSKHFIALSGKSAIIGCGRLIEIDSETVQVRSVGVEEAFRGRGVGKKLMLAMEAEAKKSGHARVFLHARENAVPFYLSLGYTLLEKSYLLFNEIQHFSMEKRIH